MNRVDVTKPFVLKEDIVLIACAELDAKLRAKIAFEDGDFTLSQRHGRLSSQVIDGSTAALLALFREPRTIASAVVENSRALGADPRKRLDEVLSPLARFVENRILVPAGSAEQSAIRPRYESGAAVAGWEIVRCVRLVEDSEIYQLRKGGELAALKIARAATAAIEALLKNELAILRRLGGGIAPRLLGAGVESKRRYLILEWIDGVEAGVASAQRINDRASLIDLCASIAAAYAELHGRGVLHGDVNPRNLLAGNRVTMLDFGYSRLIDRRPAVGRGGVQYFFEPEYLAARRRGKFLPPSAAGEQYSVAALLYLLITGRQYLEFRFEREEMERQAENDPPLPFAARGIPPWPEVEQILFRALEKNPAWRYGSMAEMAAALAGARDNALRESLVTPVSADAHEFLEATLRSFGRGGKMFEAGYAEPPTASITDGCAGAAVALLRIAEARSDAATLALADVWKSRAFALSDDDDAWSTDPLVGPVTPWHKKAGAHAAAAMIAAARGDGPARRRGVAAFLAASGKPCKQLDLTLGRSGSLLAAALLLEAGNETAEGAALRAFGTRTMETVWRELDKLPAIEDSPSGTFLGIAHGWAGYIYAALRWCAASGDPLPPRLVERLHEYVPLKTRKGRGAFWSPRIDDAPYGLIPTWCNGSAGQVFLFTLAHRVLGGAEWLDLAELCAWNSWDEPRSNTSLCCGTAGRAYALLNLYKQTGAAEWLSRARQLANHAAGTDMPPVRRETLWKGELGIAVLIADLASPENARMPFFE